MRLDGLKDFHNSMKSNGVKKVNLYLLIIM